MAIYFCKSSFIDVWQGPEYVPDNHVKFSYYRTSFAELRQSGEWVRGGAVQGQEEECKKTPTPSLNILD